MKAKFVLRSLTILAIGLIHEPATLISQIRPTPTGIMFRLFTDATLEIQSSETPFLPLQPIPLTLKLRNRTDAPVRAYNSISLDGFPLAAYVQPIGGERRRVRKLSLLSGLTGVIHSVIPPGSEVSGKGWLTLKLSEYFPRPGTYEIQLRLFDSDATESIESNVIRIEIRSPNGADRLAHDFIQDSSFKDYLFSGQDFETSRFTLERIATLFPNSGYAKSASFVLGENYFYARDYSRALTNLVRLENDSNFIHSDRVRHFLAEIRRSIVQQNGIESVKLKNPN